MLSNIQFALVNYTIGISKTWNGSDKQYIRNNEMGPNEISDNVVALQVSLATLPLLKLLPEKVLWTSVNVTAQQTPLAVTWSAPCSHCYHVTGTLMHTLTTHVRIVKQLQCIRILSNINPVIIPCTLMVLTQARVISSLHSYMCYACERSTVPFWHSLWSTTFKSYSAVFLYIFISYQSMMSTSYVKTFASSTTMHGIARTAEESYTKLRK